jgi:phosphatidylserine decarboxylase
MVKEGYWYGLPLVLISGGLMGLRLYWPGAFVLALAFFVLNFFRDPDRIIPADFGAIVSPADGRVLQMEEHYIEGCTMQRLSIFMSPFDVHVNRSPIAGAIKAVSYRKGAFHIATQARASVENEQNVFTVQGEQEEIIVKQIAGVIARRIIFWKGLGDRLERGERVGMIKFGSRVDVIVGPSVDWRVKVGDRVRAGSSILGISRAKARAGT